MVKQSITRSAIRPTKERIEDKLLGIPGVNAVDINEKITNGKPTGILCIVVFVDEKRPKTRVKKEELIPNEIEGIPTDVQEEKNVLHSTSLLLKEAAPHEDTTKYAELHGGISIGPCRSVYMAPPEVPVAGNYVFTGTLGAMVKDRTTNALMALTNFHVACIDDGWSVGDTMAQPSLVDGGNCPADRFGTLTRAVLSENIDGAVISLDQGAKYACTIEDIGDVRGTAAASQNMVVRKRGRTTGLTYGSVSSTDLTVSMPYGDGIGVRTLKHQIRVNPDTIQNPRFSDHGDSGSVVVNGENKVIGLLYGGTLSGSVSYLNPIQKVLDELGVNLCVKTISIVTKPVICEPLKTKQIVCVISKSVACELVTKPKICQIVTSPKYCQIKTLTACPPKTLACPPVSLACGFDPGRSNLMRSGTTDPQAVDEMRRLYSVYGQADEAVDDAFWFGYYSALEAMADEEDAGQD